MSNVEHDASGFTADGRAPFPPIYEDLKAMDFVDDQRWPTQKLMGRLAWYESFLKRDDPMPRARGGAQYLKEHIMFELLCREGFFDYFKDGVESDETENTPIL